MAIKTCKQCSVTYEEKKGKKTIFCSKSCSGKYKTIHKVRFSKDVKCLFCGISFEVSFKSWQFRKFCSHKCYWESRKGMKFTNNHKNNLRLSISLDKRREIGMLGLVSQQNSKLPTSIERKLYEELKNRGLLFETQKLINGRFLVDAYIPSLNLVIEADGDYWHSLDRVVKKDKAENAYLKKCGFKTIRISEKEINSGDYYKIDNICQL